MRRIALIGLVLVLAGVVWFLSLRSGGPERAPPSATPTRLTPTHENGAISAPGGSSSGDAPLTSAILAAEFPIVAPLNRPDSNLARDLETVAHVLDAWRSNFPREGNPVGENADITAALAGENRLGLVLIPRRHSAINAAGELCDRWGTPFRFHQISGQHMEIRSAGPDRKFATPDDAIWNPAPE